MCSGRLHNHEANVSHKETSNQRCCELKFDKQEEPVSVTAQCSSKSRQQGDTISEALGSGE